MAKRLVWVPFACAALALVSADAAALPTPYNVVASVDDAYLGLRLVTDRIQGDSRSLCGVHIEVTDTLVPLTAGDRVYLAVYEDDLAGDDELWTYDFAVTAAEVSAGFVWRDFDCSGDFGEDVAGGLEIYATARVEKAACTGFCVWDRPETRAVALTDLADDEAEDDDTIDTANPATAGTTESRIATDADHHRFELTGGSNVEVTVAFDATVGAVDVDLLDGAGVLIASAFDTDTGASLVRTLDAGTYFVRTTPRAAPDFNFYDLRVDLSSATCTVSESRACGMCGVQTRDCAGGEWQAWGACEDEGECSPGAHDSRGCGVGGIEARVCSDVCAWGAFGACEGMVTDDDGGMSGGVDAGEPPVAIDGGVEPGVGSDAGPSAMTGGGCAVGGGPRSGASLLPLLLGALFVFRARSRRGRRARGRSAAAAPRSTTP